MSGTWYYTWSKSKVKDTEIPTHPHWAIMVFHDHRYTEAAYDEHDSPSTATVRACDYYAFPDKETWEKMIKDIYREKYSERAAWHYNNDNENIVFFHSPGRGVADVNIQVNVAGK